jgi:ubiquinone/menaquinone biosynthesis C-methylase UbiE
MIESMVHPGDRVLDIGMGTGLLAEYAAARGARYEGIDYSGAMLARAARKVAARNLGGVSLRWGDARSLPFEDDSFDVVVSSFVFPHFAEDEKPQVLREILRVLKPGGHLGLYVARGEVVRAFCRRDELERLLVECGLADLRIEDHDDVYRIAKARKPAQTPMGRSDTKALGE